MMGQPLCSQLTQIQKSFTHTSADSWNRPVFPSVPTAIPWNIGSGGIAAKLFHKEKQFTVAKITSSSNVHAQLHTGEMDKLGNMTWVKRKQKPAATTPTTVDKGDLLDKEFKKYISCEI